MQDSSSKSPPNWFKSLAAFLFCLPFLGMLHLVRGDKFEPLDFFVQAVSVAVTLPLIRDRANRQAAANNEAALPRKRRFTPAAIDHFLAQSFEWLSLHTLGGLFTLCGVAACAIHLIVGSINAWQVAGITVGVPLYLSCVVFLMQRLYGWIEKRDAQKRQRGLASAESTTRAEELVTVPEVTTPLPQMVGSNAVERVELQTVQPHGMGG